MNVFLLGGASGIGASCVAIEVGAKWIIVDAGIRMDPNVDRLPDIAFLQQKDVAAIFVTHAHADHIGAIPLVHQAFPLAPIYTSRATMHLMEVMLADALNVMQKRATDVFEVPLYNQEMVTAALHSLYPIPMNGTMSLPDLPDVTVHTARAGHVAGAITIGFETKEGRILVSGDVSMTPQRSILGAEVPSLHHPDLLILESTYGSRLHPNRQAEEDRLSQAVAKGIERGHVLIPAFALGRAQEVLLILNEAQRQGRIPEFPIWVDGLVRTVCTTYTAIPEALTPRLQRQIHKGFAPFFTGMVRSVTNHKQREKLLEGSPACVVTSSGMLTGGPSAYYASHLAGREDASILITGYQDEEAPGRKLLNLADKKEKTIELNGQTITVNCQFDRYSLSAHADGSELTAFVSHLKPRQVALVHGDQEARTSLGQQMHTLSEIIMPEDGNLLTIEKASTKRARKRGNYSPKKLGEGIGHKAELKEVDLPQLWQAVSDRTGSQMLSIRELAITWHGSKAGEQEEENLRQLLSHNQQYFVPSMEIMGMVRVRAAEEVTEEGGTATPRQKIVQPGSLLLLNDARTERSLPALCFDMRASAVWAYLPAGAGGRKRFPTSAIIDVIGKWPSYPFSTDVEEVRSQLEVCVRGAKAWQRSHPMKDIVHAMQPARSYSFEEIAAMLGVAEEDMEGRIGLGLLLNTSPELVTRQSTDTLLNHTVSYHLSEQWQQALAEGKGEVQILPDQNWILTSVKEVFGEPSGLYRTSINPMTGDVNLYFHFPSVAKEQYAEKIAEAATKTGVKVTISPKPHQGALKDAAQKLLPDGTEVLKISVLHDQHIIRIRCATAIDQPTIQQAAQTFHKHTGWQLEIQCEGKTSGKPGGNQPNQTSQTSQTGQPSQTGQLSQTSQSGQPDQPDQSDQPSSSPQKALDQNSAASVARGLFDSSTECYKVGMDIARTTLVLKFYFPDVANERYRSRFEEVQEKTGWQVEVYPEPHHAALQNKAKDVVPEGATISGRPSLYLDERKVVVRYQGEVEEQALAAAQEQFCKTTGWTLLLQKR